MLSSLPCRFLLLAMLLASFVGTWSARAEEGAPPEPEESLQLVIEEGTPPEPDLPMEEVAKQDEPAGLANPADLVPLHEIIDEQITASFAKWNAGDGKVTAAESCTDAEFLRRATLDFTGTIPTAEETTVFLADSSPDKRAKLIDRLLESEAYARRMAVVFDVMLMERRPDKHIETPEWREYLQASFAANKPLNTLVHEILAGSGVEEATRPAAKFFLDRDVDKDALVVDIGRLLLGVNMQCAQCHDHPGITDYLHQHYHGLSVFVAGSKTFKQPDGKIVLQEMVTREVEFASVFYPEDTKTTGPRLLDALMDIPEMPEGEEYVEKPSSKIRAVPKFSLRALLAEKLASQETPEFAANMANRLWAMMMGRGLVHPLDMHHSDNPASHPELLAALSKRLSETGFDTKAFLRELALSETYARSSLLPEGVSPDQVPPESFAVSNMRGLSPEQLFDSLLTATGSEKLFQSQIEQTLQEDNEAYQKLLEDKEKLTAARAEQRTEKIDEFVSLFGSAAGQPEGEFQASLPQALFLANGETVISWLQPGENNLTEQLLKQEDPAKLIEQAYLHTLSRRSTVEEQIEASEFLTANNENKEEAVIELVWTLLASAEFRLNH